MTNHSGEHSEARPKDLDPNRREAARGLSEANAGDGERGRADDDSGPMHLPRGKGSELWFVEKDGQVDVSGLDSPSDCERSEGPMRKA